MRRGWLLMLALLVAPGALVAGAQSTGSASGLAEILIRVGRSVERYYARAQSIICVETVSLRTLGYDLMSDSTPARRLLFELRVAWEPSEDGAAPAARVQRQLIEVNSRPPRPKDKQGCTDPTPVSPDTLEMLLPAKQVDYTFKLAGNGRIGGRTAVMLDFRARQAGPIAARAHEDREDCYHVDMPGRTRGRVWIDAETDDILRIDEHLIGAVDVRVPQKMTRSRLALDVTFERLDSSTIYRPVSFTDPEETIMLPASADSLAVIRNSGVPRQRTTQRFSNYRRFTTGGRVIDQ